MSKSKIFKQASLLAALLIFPVFIFSQSSANLDEDFINSLPENLQDEINNENAEENQVDKLLNSKTSSLKNKEALKLLKQKIEDLDNQINKNEDAYKDNRLERFGDSFFSSIQSTFMPVNVPNLRDDYILGIGDKLSIQIIGDSSEILNGLTIERDGSLSIPDLGKVFVATKTLPKSGTVSYTHLTLPTKA